MSNFILTCCSTADMPLEYFRERNIPFVCFHFNIDGKQYPDDLGQTMPFDDFYNKIAKGAMPTTSQVNVDQFVEFFEPFLKDGKDIIHASLSSGISGAFNSANIARNDLLAKYPERTIYIVDSMAASSGYGLFMDMAADLRDKGASIDEVHDFMEQEKLTIHHWFFSTDLTHLKRGGRIPATSAFIGNLLNICPLLNVSSQGQLVPREKIRGKKNVIQATVKKMEQHAQDGLDYSGKCFISNSACFEDAKAVADLIEKRFKKLCGKVMINSIGTVIGSHTGPGTVALYFVGDKRID